MITNNIGICRSIFHMQVAAVCAGKLFDSINVDIQKFILHKEMHMHRISAQGGK